MDSTIRCRIFSSLEELPDSYRETLRSHPELPFDQTFDWLESYIEHVGPKNSLLIIGAERKDSGSPCALLPLDMAQGDGLLPRLATVSGLSNYYSTHFDLNVLDAEVQPVVMALADALKTMLPKWAELDLNPVSSGSEATRAMLEAMNGEGFRSESYFRFANWKVKVTGQDYEAYMSRRPSKLVQTVKRRTRKLERAGKLEIAIITDPEEVEAAMDSYEQIYATSWKVPEPYPQFIRDIAMRFARRNWLRLGVLTLDGVPAASQIWFAKHGIASIFKLAYDPQFSKLSPGSVLSAELTRFVLEKDHVDEIDFLSGDDAYKQDWMEERAEMVGLRVYRLGSVIGMKGALKSGLGKLLKRSA